MFLFIIQLESNYKLNRHYIYYAHTHEWKTFFIYKQLNNNLSVVVTNIINLDEYFVIDFTSNLSKEQVIYNKSCEYTCHISTTLNLEKQSKVGI